MPLAPAVAQTATPEPTPTTDATPSPESTASPTPGVEASPTASADPTPATIDPHASEAASQDGPPRQVEEVVGKRTKHTKTFLTEDGTFMTEAHLDPIHFRDESGDWKEIDTTIVQRPDGSWTNKAGPFDASFAGASGGTLLDIVRSGARVALEAPGSRRGVAPIVSGSVIDYPEVFPSVDVRFVVRAESVEELFVLKEVPTGPTSFTVPLKLRGLSAAEQTDGSIVLANPAGDAVFTIPSLVMYDSGEDPDVAPLDVTVRTSEGALVLDIAADGAWLRDPERSYPVLVDPEVTLNAPYQDAWIKDGDTTTHADDPELRVGYSEDAKRTRGLVKFREFGEANFTHVTGAWMYMTPTYSDPANCATGYHGIHQITADWSPLTVTWGNAPSGVETALDTESVGCAATAEQKMFSSASLTSLVQKWVGALQFDGVHGVYVRSTSSETSRTYFRRWASKNYSDSTKRPKLKILYDPHAGKLLEPVPGSTVSSSTPQLSTGLDAVSGHTDNFRFELYAAGASPGQSDNLSTCPTNALSCYTSGSISTTQRASWNATLANGAPLQDGATYHWRVRSANRYGPWSGVQSFTVNLPAPSRPRITASPTSPSNNTRPTWGFDSNGESGTTFTCSLSGAESRPTSSCSSGAWPSSWAALSSNGSYTFAVQQTRNGKTSEAASGAPYVLDTVRPPAPGIDGAPTSPSNGSSVQWSFSGNGESGGTFKCQLTKNGSVYDWNKTCTSPQSYQLSSTVDSTYTFEVYQVDAAGNTSPTTTSSYVHDVTAPPPPSINAAPTSPNASRYPEWRFTGEARATFSCRLLAPGQSPTGSTPTYEPCSSPHQVSMTPQSSYPDGTYTFQVRQADAATNVSKPASSEYTLEAREPSIPEVSSATHLDENKWYSNNDPRFSWIVRTPPASGIARYHYIFSSDPQGEPTEGAQTQATSAALRDQTDGVSYFRIRARSNAGALSGVGQRVVRVDTVAPARPTSVTSSTHTPYVAFAQRRIEVQWTEPEDVRNEGVNDVSGVDRYHWEFRTTDGGGAVGSTYRSPAGDPTAESGELDDGTYWFHVAAVDRAGNVSQSTVYGPLVVDDSGSPVPLTPSLDDGLRAQSDTNGMERFYPYRSFDLGSAPAYTNLHSGNLVVQQEDVSIPAPGLNAVIRHTYNSHRASPDYGEAGVGRGWVLSLSDLDSGADQALDLVDVDLTNPIVIADVVDVTGAASGLVLELTDGDGTVHRFVRRGTSQTFQSPPGVNLRVFEELRLGLPSAYRLVRPDGVTYVATQPRIDAVSTPTWHITAVEDRNGNRLTIGYQRAAAVATDAELAPPTGPGYPIDPPITDPVDDPPIIFGPITGPIIPDPSDPIPDLPITEDPLDPITDSIDRITDPLTPDDNTVPYDPIEDLVGPDPLNPREPGVGPVRVADLRHSRVPSPIASFSYDASGNLAAIVSLPGRSSLDPATGTTRSFERRTSFVVDADTGLLRTVTDASHTTDAQGRRTTSYLYSKQGGLDADPPSQDVEVAPLGGDEVLAAVIDPRTKRTDFAYGSTTGRLRVVQVEERSATWSIDYGTADPNTGDRTSTVRPPGPSRATEYRISGRSRISDTDPRIAGGNILRITDPGAGQGGVRKSYTWDKNRLVERRDGAGNVTSMEYDALGMLTKLTTPPPNARPGGPANAPLSPIDTVFTYGYSATHIPSNCSEAISTSPRVDPTSAVAYLEKVERAANVAGQTRTTVLTNDACANLRSVTEKGAPTDRTTTFTYEDGGFLSTIDGPRADILDKTTYRYGASRSTGIADEIEDARGLKKVFVISPYGEVLQERDRDGNITKLEYDERDNLIRSIDALNRVATQKYDANDNMIVATSPRGVETADGDDFEKRFEYDAMDRRTVVSLPGKDDVATRTVTTKDYNPDGSLLLLTRPNGARERYAYHPNGSIKLVEADAVSSFDAITSFSYDAAGRLNLVRGPKATSAAGDVRPERELEYTPAGAIAVTKQTSSSGARDRVSEAFYNSHGELIDLLGPRTASNGARSRHRYGFDNFGQLARYETLAAPGKWLVTSYAYDLAGNMKRIDQPFGNGGALTSTYDFDALNRLSVQTRDAHVPGKTVAFTYSGEGDQRTRADRAGGVTRRRTTSTYNADRTLQSRVSESLDVQGNVTETRGLCNFAAGAAPASGYDPDGNVLVARTTEGGCRGTTIKTETYRYDHRGWVDRVSQSLTVPGFGAASRTQGLAYRSDGVVASSTWENVTTRFAHTSGGFLSRVTDWRSKVSTFGRLPSGGLSRMALGAGTATATLQQHPDGSTKQLTWANATGTTVRSHTAIDYYVDGLRRSENVSIVHPADQTGDTGGSTLLDYDAAGRLTRFDSPFALSGAGSASTVYALDDAGNVTGETTTSGATTRSSTLSYDSYGRLAQRTTTLTGSPMQTVTVNAYSPLGEETKRTMTIGTDPSTATDTSYDPGGHTKLVDRSGASSDDVSYVYDGTGNVIAKTELSTGRKTLFFYFAGTTTLAEEADGQGSTRVRYLVTPEGDTLAEERLTGTNPGWVWLLKDVKGSVGTELRDDGAVAATRSYDPYGASDVTGSTVQVGHESSSLGFQTAYTDKVTGNVLLGPRQYDPATQRFTSADFFVGSAADVALGTDPLTGNRYLFAGANPVAFFDDGHMPQDGGKGGRGYNVHVSQTIYHDPVSMGTGARNFSTAARDASYDVFARDIVEGWRNANWGQFTWGAVGVVPWTRILNFLRGARAVLRGTRAAPPVPPSFADDVTHILAPGGELVGAPGMRDGVRTLPSRDALEDLFEQLSSHGIPTTRTYGGRGFDLPNGGFVGLRHSRRWGTTIDVNLPGFDIDKFHLPE